MLAVPSLLNTKLQNKDKHNQLYRVEKSLKHRNIIYVSTQPSRSFSRSNSKAESNQTVLTCFSILFINIKKVDLFNR